ncbi:MAG TPA: hypothetical protein VK927_03570 [Adhaeribacter sp.]|nr:hypothetical protein [Adhaeribacter sp.]
MAKKKSTPVNTDLLFNLSDGSSAPRVKTRGNQLAEVWKLQFSGSFLYRFAGLKKDELGRNNLKLRALS